MLTVPDLAEKVNVSERTVYAWVKKKKVPYYKIQQGIRFDEQEIEEWIKRQKQAPKEESDKVEA